MKRYVYSSWGRHWSEFILHSNCWRTGWHGGEICIVFNIGSRSGINLIQGSHHWVGGI
jgi:hypothetical protein